ncbi:hypothetical protein GGX14DRAFT_595008 [Mycena pura]|uniref:Uncharacterized protein n=1 Tax=Mycena pura TaxID=153505 RepID=A0AAD6VNR2_9AGAR|nr:hypothetical protein GGX14DRAFT_595008 [Mycena pura]
MSFDAASQISVLYSGRQLTVRGVRILTEEFSTRVQLARIAHGSRLPFSPTSAMLLSVFCVFHLFLTSTAAAASAFLSAAQSVTDCTSCLNFLGTLQEIAREGTDPFIANLTSFCISLDAEDPDVCTGIIAREGPILAHDLRQINTSGLTALRLCDALFGHPRPRTPRCSRRAAAPVRVVHISDVHIDRMYTVGAEANCTKSFCCREFDDSPAVPTVPAGPNGNVRCDSPVTLADSMLAEIERLHPRFSRLTGDVVVRAGPNGNVRCDSPVTLADSMLAEIERLHPRFSRLTGDVVVRATWLVDQAEVTTELRDFNAEMAANLTAPVFPSLVSVSVLPHRPTSVRVVPQRLRAGQRIRAHDEPHGEQLAVCVRHIDRVLELQRADGVALIVRVLVNLLLSLTFLGPCIDSDEQVCGCGNPAFKAYDIDPDTFEMMDASVFLTNVSDPNFQVTRASARQAHRPQPAEWGIFYSARATYGPLVGIAPGEPLSPAFWHNLTDVIAANDTAFHGQLFNTFISRDGMVTPCDAASGCVNTTICDMRALRSENNCVRGSSVALDAGMCALTAIGHAGAWIQPAAARGGGRARTSNARAWGWRMCCPVWF